MAKKQKHGLKIIRRFAEDLWGILGIQNKPSSVLHFIYENYKNNFKYRKLLKNAHKSFFFNKKEESFYIRLYLVKKNLKEKDVQ